MIHLHLYQSPPTVIYSLNPPPSKNIVEWDQSPFQRSYSCPEPDLISDSFREVWKQAGNTGLTAVPHPLAASIDMMIERDRWKPTYVGYVVERERRIEVGAGCGRTKSASG